ncbi:glycogen synthase [Shewanella sp. c952]|uniref:glycogen synthase n=1 Tax=Shewanella sp. c952 TaxID=2815913 RepID=UPI001C7CC06F|nr:glycogen/starch synthase [Shewanella sp. c952]
MLAAENGAIAGAKVGGMADVVRDLPLALAQHNVAVDVAMPSYGFLQDTIAAKLISKLRVNFAGREEQISVYKAAHPSLDDCYCYLFSHPLFNAGGEIYSQGDASRPFATDASKFALFSLAVATALTADSQAIDANETGSVIMPPPDIIHLHDWHCGFFAILRAFDPSFEALAATPCVFSIHNLALQGIRPLADEASSLAAWFPQLTAKLDEQQLAAIVDPRYRHCVNPLRAAIVLSDRVHLVSPSYATEVLKPSIPEQGFFGGEGLEVDLQAKLEQGRVIGILNGCMYDTDIDDRQACQPSARAKCSVSGWQALLLQAESALLRWQVGKEQVSSQHFVAQSRLQQWQNSAQLAKQQSALADEAPFLMTSVGRLTDQKVMILRYRFPGAAANESFRAKTVLQVMLERLTLLKPNGQFILLGSGDKQIAREFSDLAAQHNNFVFLDGYDEQLSSSLYQSGSLFLMPSSFEPCGISQMLAMREGQLCLVNHVGGLKDTVQHMETGFVFEGSDMYEQGAALITSFEAALALHASDKWRAMELLAKQQRFDWHSQAKQYVDQLYCL